MKKSLVTMTLAGLVLVAVALPAQIEPAPYITVHYDRIDPAQMAAYDENNKDWVEAFSAAKAGSDFYWRGYQSGFTYAWVGGMPNFAYLDDNDAREKMLAEKMGEDKLEELQSGAGTAVVEHHTEIWKYESEMSYQPAGLTLEGKTAVNVAVVSVKPSMGSEYREVVKEAIAALGKVEAPINFFAYSTPFGRGSYAFVSWAKDRGALHSGPDIGALLAEAVGPEKAQELFARYVKTVASEEERDWRFRPEISYVSDAEMAAESEEME